jgi:hypothetical protein
MAELQTKKTKASVSTFLNAIADDQKRKDCKAVAAIMQKATKAKPEILAAQAEHHALSRLGFPGVRQPDGEARHSLG